LFLGFFFENIYEILGCPKWFI